MVFTLHPILSYCRVPGCGWVSRWRSIWSREPKQNCGRRLESGDMFWPMQILGVATIKTTSLQCDVSAGLSGFIQYTVLTIFVNRYKW